MVHMCIMYKLCIFLYFLYYINLFVFTEIHVCSMHTCTCSDTYMKLHTKCVYVHVCIHVHVQ